MIFKETKFNLAKQIVSKNVNTFNRKKIVQNDLKKKKRVKFTINK